MPKHKKTPEDFNRIVWVRNQLLSNPDIGLDGILAKWEEENLPKDQRPTTPVLAQAKNTLRKRWGVSLEDVPRKMNGEINKAALIRLYLDMFGMDVNETDAKAYLAEDGITLSTGQFHNAKSLYARQKDGLSEELDPNQHTGPRARRVSKKGRKRRKGGRRREEEAEVHGDKETFESMERQLEKLMSQVGRRQNLRDALRHARRLVSAELVAMD